jgi:hypothetical protein
MPPMVVRTILINPAPGERRKDFNPRLLRDLFLCISLVREEVPVVNKPRRACSYVPPTPKGELRNLIIYQRSFLVPPDTIER